MTSRRDSPTLQQKDALKVVQTMVDTSVRSAVEPVTAELRRLMDELRDTHPLPTQVSPAAAPSRSDVGGEPQRAGGGAVRGFEQRTQRVAQQQTLLQSTARNMPQGLGLTGACSPWPVGAIQTQLQGPTPSGTGMTPPPPPFPQC